MNRLEKDKVQFGIIGCGAIANISGIYILNYLE